MSDKIASDHERYLDIVERMEQALCIVPFRMQADDAVALLSMAANNTQYRLRIEDLEQTNRRLQAALDRHHITGFSCPLCHT